MRIRTDRLRKTVSHAFQAVPFYRNLYQASDVSIRDIQASDIYKLPVTTSTDFRRAPILMRTALDAKVSSCIVHTTSGTTGVPVCTLEDPYSAAYREALMLRFLWAYGVRPHDKIARGRYMSRSTYPKRLAETGGSWGMLRRRFLKQRFFTTFDDQSKFLSEWHPDVLLANSSYCKALARHCEETERKLQFRTVVTWGELLDASTRNLIENSFQAEVFDQYGIEEVGGSIAWECPTHSGYHINVESLILEFLRNGEPVAAGEAGGMYVTCFHRLATPIVRYFTGDIARTVDDVCPCGRGLPLMREIQGRVVDYILTPAGRHVSPHQIMGVLADTPGVAQYKVTQKEDFSIEVSIVTDSNETEPVIKDVQRGCTELFGDTSLNVKLVDKIDVASGKFRVVESRITG